MAVPEGTEGYHHKVFTSYLRPGDALREAAEWIAENTDTVWAEHEDYPVLIVNDISIHEYESCWSVHVYCEEFSG